MVRIPTCYTEEAIEVRALNVTMPCRGLIRRALDQAAKELNADLEVEDADRQVEIDQDTQGVPGSPSIAETILRKIRECDVFVSDLTFMPGSDEDPRQSPNPNVLIEHGYALHALGDDRIIGVFNEVFGSPNNLPFDLRHKKWPIRFEAGDDSPDDGVKEERRNARETLANRLTDAIRDIIQTLEDVKDTAIDDAAEGERQSTFLTSLAEILITALILADQAEERGVKPWVDDVQIHLIDVAQELREAAAEDSAAEMNLDTSLQEIADILDRAGSYHFSMGGEPGDSYEGYLADARARAQDVMAAHIYTLPLSDGAREEVRDTMRKSVRQLADLDRRAGEMENSGRINDVQVEAHRLGSSLLRLSYYQIDDIAEGLANSLRPIANDLDLLEIKEIKMDGGQSMRRILEKLHDLSSRLQSLLSEKNI